MKFLKNYGEYNSINEAKRADKDSIQEEVVKFLDSKKDIFTLSGITKGTKLKTDNIYMALVELGKGKDKKVDYVNVTHFDENPKRNYPYYYSIESLSKAEAEALAKEKSNKSEEENKALILKRKETAKKAAAEKEEATKKAAEKRKVAAKKKESGETKPAAAVKKNGEPAKPRGRKKKAE